ncbi:hypothetical protein Pcinc_029289 [Petrolisthes cinctipes]|uniref:Uncharacterized protein n=1 Tax=Petrolisthes cinctipes TaxID=88211 RepID=A0AAE1F161_PETCI|nr:hypothetical protein Pcinc_029289 [Petrolisthes cinctipes]
MLWTVESVEVDVPVMNEETVEEVLSVVKELRYGGGSGGEMKQYHNTPPLHTNITTYHHYIPLPQHNITTYQYHNTPPLPQHTTTTYQYHNTPPLPQHTTTTTTNHQYTTKAFNETKGRSTALHSGRQ